MKLKQTVLSLVIFSLISTVMYGQPKLDIFGFAQAKVSQTNILFTSKYQIPTQIGPMWINSTPTNTDNLSSGNQQLNLFLKMDINNDWTSWVNFEVVNDYSSKQNQGSFNLEEIWVKYSPSEKFNVKVGLLIPTFNSLNEIKNRTPLLPYIIRPLVYETSTSQYIDISNFLPEKAFLQVYGTLPADKFKFEYAGYAGNAERGYIDANGDDTTKLNFKLVGGRVGFRYGDLGVGVSATVDKDNQRVAPSPGTLIVGDDVNRFRIGADISYTLENFFFNGEYINVKLSPKNNSQDIGKMFYYGLVGYNFNESLFAYATYNFIQDKQFIALYDGAKGISFGAGYNVNSRIILKAQYYKFWTDGTQTTWKISPSLPPVPFASTLDYKQYSLAISILF